MNKFILCFGCLAVLVGCAGPERPMYVYDNPHKLDTEFEQGNMCLLIDNDNTTVKKGHKNLSVDPFLGQEGYSPANVSKRLIDYDTHYENPYCKDGIKLSRKIEISSISYPSSCVNFQQVGSVYTGATTWYNAWNDTITTNINSRGIYNITEYPCVKTSYYTNIDFYRGKTLVGSIKNKGWTRDGDIGDTISYFTADFLNKLKEDYKESKKQERCRECFDDCESVWDRFKCALQGCSPDEI